MSPIPSFRLRPRNLGRSGPSFLLQPKMKRPILCSAVLLVFAFCAARQSQNSDPVQVTKVELTKDNGKGKPGEVVKSFSTTDRPIHCVVHVKPLGSTVVFTGTLIAVSAGTYHNFTVSTTNISAILRSEAIDFKFSIPTSWPAGSYRITVKKNNHPLREMNFDIK